MWYNEADMILPGFPKRKIKIWMVGLLVTLITVLVYLPAINNDFVNWDDNIYVYENPHIQSLDCGFWKWMFTSFYTANWHPLTLLSHALDYALWGLNPQGHHLTSILFHGLNSFLVVILVTRLLENAEIRRGRALIAGVITGLLFGLHPLHVESVAWVAERKDVLCAFFVLLSLLFYLRYVSLSLRQQRFKFYGLCLFFFSMALMSKPMALTLPVVLVILDIYPLGRLNLRDFPSQRGVWVEKLPFVGLSLASSIVTIVAQRAGGAITSLKYLPLGARILGSIRGLSFYLVKMVWPIGLAPLYPRPLRISLLNPEYTGSIVLVIGISAFCIWLWPRQRIWAGVWAYYIVTLLPVLGIIQVGSQAAADRYTYLPSLGPFLLVGIGVAWVWEKTGQSILRRLFIIIPSILIATLLANLTVKQIKVWRNSITLWDSELKQFPDRVPLAYYNRGVVYGRLGSYERAIKDFDKTVELDPQDAKAYYNRGVACAWLDNHQRAIKDFDKAIELDPQYVKAYYNRGVVYAAKGQYEETISDYKQALKINPDNIQAYNYLGYLYIDKEIDLEEGLRLIKKALSLAPENPSIIDSLGWAYYKKGMFDEALEELEKAIKLAGDGVELHEHLAKVYEKKKSYEEAAKAWKKVLEIDPQHREAQKSLTRLRTLIHK